MILENYEGEVQREHRDGGGKAKRERYAKVCVMMCLQEGDAKQG